MSTEPAPVRMILFTDEAMPVEWTDRVEAIRYCVDKFWPDPASTQDLHLRSIVNNTLEIEYGRWWVSYFMARDASDEHPVYLVYKPQYKIPLPRLREFRKEFFVRCSPIWKPEHPTSMEEELSDIFFTFAKAMNGKIVAMHHDNNIVYYKVTGDKLQFRNLYFKSARRLLKVVK